MVSMKFEVGDIFLWPMLLNIEPRLLKELDKFFVYNQGESVVLLTKSGGVYHYPYLTSTLKIDQRFEVNVNGGTVVQVDSCDKALMLLTESGDLYVYGRSEYGQLGLEKQCYESAGKLLKQGIQLVCCSRNHVLALALDGSVYAWGGNWFSLLGVLNTETRFNYGYRWKPFVWRPTLVPSLSTLEVVDLQCNETASMAVTRSRQIYLWGCDWSLIKPTRLCLPGELTFSQVSLVYSRLVAITDDGKCHIIFPKNHRTTPYNQLDDRSEQTLIHFEGSSSQALMIHIKYSRYPQFMDSTFPFHILLEPITSIDSGLDRTIAVLRSGSGMTYLLNPLSHLVTPIDSVATLADVFALYSTSHDTHRLISVPECLTKPDPTLWSITFNNPSFLCQDLKIKARGHRQLIYVSRPFLRLQVPTFVQFCDKQVNYPSLESQLKFSLNVSYAALFAFLRYVYTKNAWINIDWALDLYFLACLYEEPTLRECCHHFLSKQTTTPSLMYALAVNPNWVGCSGFSQAIITSHIQPDNCVHWFQFIHLLYDVFQMKKISIHKLNKMKTNDNLAKLHFYLVFYIHDNFEQVVRLDPHFQTIPYHLWMEIFNSARFINELTIQASSLRQDSLADYYF